MYNLGLVIKDNVRANKYFDECFELATNDNIKNLINSKRRI